VTFFVEEKMRKRESLLSAFLALSLALPAPFFLARGALAQSGSEEQKTPEELALEGVDSLMRALELMVEKIPQYEMPEINERGDIIIRRKNPPPEESAPEAKPETAPDETET
jgi:hypothetical protein